jgi:energy-coupling factor transporter ATP-binding protein EcfA2
VSDAGSSLLAENMDHRFELRDLNVRFPESKLSLITGPTASGKTALLVCPKHFLSFCTEEYRTDGSFGRDDFAPGWEDYHVEDPEPDR